MTLKICPSCKITQTTKNAEKKGRDAIALYFNCKFCGSTFILRSKKWKELLGKPAPMVRNAAALIAMIFNSSMIVFLGLLATGLIGCAEASYHFEDGLAAKRSTDETNFNSRQCEGMNRHQNGYISCMAGKGYFLVQDKN